MPDKKHPPNNFAATFPRLLEEWHQDKNKDLSPYSLSPHSTRKVWWQCKEGHEWEAALSNRTGRGKNGCPFCSGRYATNINNFALLFPDLLNEWCYEKNTSFVPEKMTPYSGKKVWWKCKEGHEWEAVISSRTGKSNNGCPFCSGKKATDLNNFGSLFPDLLNEWSYERNASLNPHKMTPYNNQKVWWKCKEGHEWQTGIVHRTRRNTACPYCSGRLAGLDNSLAILHPTLSIEWDQEKNENLTPNDVRPGTDKKVWWLCAKGHSWKAAVCHRTHNTKSTDCPYCSGRKASDENNFKVLFPKLAEEWDFTKNGVAPLLTGHLETGNKL